jgi:hypothetical protein
MSTKDLSRTIIEGGRRAGNRWTRRHTNATLRAETRDALARAADWDALAVPEREPLHKEFDDKLGPPLRWLERQVGRPWSAVYSDLKKRFDPRTTAGRHIVYDHLLHWVDEGNTDRPWAVHVAVDERGILRPAARRRFRYDHKLEPLPRPERELERWLAGRRVGARGPALFWFTATAAGAYRQHVRLEGEDVALWRSLPAWFREQHVPTAPPPAAPQAKV